MLSDGQLDGWRMAIEAIDKIIACTDAGKTASVKTVLTILRDVMKAEAERQDEQRTHA